MVDKSLGIKKYQWHAHGGQVLTANGLKLIPKIGELILGRGKYKGKQIVSEEWIKECCIPRFKTYDGIGAYGYQCWLTKWKMRDGHEVEVSFALGYMGQYIIVIPELKLVAAITASLEDSMLPLHLLEEEIVIV